MLGNWGDTFFDMAQFSELYRRCGRTGLIAIGLLLLGGITFLHASANQGGLSMDCARFLAEKPNGKWARLSGCVVSRILSVPKVMERGAPKEVFVPIRPESAKPEREIRLLLASDHPGDLEFVKRAQEQSSTSSGRAMFRSSYSAGVGESRNIEGRILRGLDLPDRDRVKLTKIFPTLAQDFIIIESRPRPSFGLPVFLMLLGCAVGGIRAYGLLKHRISFRGGFSRPEMPAVAK